MSLVISITGVMAVQVAVTGDWSAAVTTAGTLVVRVELKFSWGAAATTFVVVAWISIELYLSVELPRRLLRSYLLSFFRGPECY